MLVGVGVPVEAAEVAGVLDDADVVCLSDAVAPGAVADAQRELAVLLDRHGRANFNLLDLERQPDTAIGALAGDPALRALMDDLVRVACPAGEWPHLSASFGSALNVTVGTDRPARVGTLHYDASVVTVVIPLLVPDVGAGQSGELVLFPTIAGCDGRWRATWSTSSVPRPAAPRGACWHARSVGTTASVWRCARAMRTCSGATGRCTETCPAQRVPCAPP